MTTKRSTQPKKAAPKSKVASAKPGKKSPKPQEARVRILPVG